MYTRTISGKVTTIAAMALSLIGWQVWPVQADHLNFTLYNRSGMSIVHLYISQAGRGSRGDDILGLDTLPSGRSTRITFPGQTPESPCLWDIRVDYSNYTYSQKRFDLCKGGPIVVR